MFRFKFINFLSFLVAFSLTSCKNKIQEEVTKSPDGKIEKVVKFQQNGDKKDLVKETRFYPNGNKQIEGGYKNNQREGKWEYWFENGNKQSEGTFDNGVRVGEAKVWYENGKPIYTGYYSNGKPDKVWVIYNKKGEKESEILYNNGIIVKQTHQK